MRIETVAAGGHDVAVAFHGPKADAAPTLVFLHEGLGSIGQWRDVPHKLAVSTGCGALVYDRWGYGMSAPLPPPYARPADFMQREARGALPDLLSHFGVRDAVLIGHSDGGTIALIAAAGSDARIAGVIAIAAHSFVEPISIESIQTIGERWQTSDLRAKLARFHGDRVDGAFLGWARTWLDPEFRDFDIRPLLGKIGCPVLAMQGTDDAYGTAAQISAIADNVSGPVQTLMIADCGHAPHHEAPDQVQSAMVAFIRMCANRPRSK